MAAAVQSIAACAASPPGRQGEVVGVRTMMLSASSTLLPLVFGALGAALGMAPVFLAMAAGVIGAGRRLPRPRA